MTHHVLTITPDRAIPQSLVGDVRSRIAYVDPAVAGADVAEDGARIDVRLRSAPDLTREAVIRAGVADVVQSVCAGFKPKLRVIEDRSRAFAGGTDPMPALLAAREVVSEGPGVFLLGPTLSRLVAWFEARMEAIAAELGAEPFRVPAMIPPAYLERLRYFRNFPHSLTFATHLREGLDGIRRFAGGAAVGVDGAVQTDPADFAAPPMMLAPTICHHLYLALSGCTVEGEGLVATASGHCFRYESSNMVSLERVWNFTMREIVFVGGAGWVRDRLDVARAALRDVLGVMALSHRVMTANDPFFVDGFSEAASLQDAMEMKYEIRADLPYKADTIAVGSYNRHGTFFGKQLDIRLANGDPACTGCVGIGFERLALAFVAQHGIDPAGWPEAVARALPSRGLVRAFRPHGGGCGCGCG